MIRPLIITACLILPGSVGAVSISEIAWMGDSDSANNEWIELYNDGQGAVSLDGWTLLDGLNLNIELAGSIAAGEYVLLERNRSDGRFQTNPPFLTYTGALINSGATLVLKNANGATEDQVAGGEDWSAVGGDNTTKETAQYTGSRWVTAAPSPGQGISADALNNKDSDDTENETDPPATAQAKTGPIAPKTIPLVLPGRTLDLAVSLPARGYVNQPLAFAVEPSGIGRTLVESLEYHWNFGDMATSARQETSHSYQYPGTYVVTVTAAYKRQTALARAEVTILPVNISLTRNPAGDIQVHNNAPYDIDVSGYQLVGRERLSFPDHSIILSNNTVTIPHQRLSSGPGVPVAIYDGAGASLAQTDQITLALARPGPAAGAPILASSPDPAALAEADPPSGSNPAFTFRQDEGGEAATATGMAPDIIGPASAEPLLAGVDSRSLPGTAGPADDRSVGPLWPLLSLIALVAGAILTLRFSRG